MGIMDAVMPKLSREARKQLDTVVIAYLQRYGKPGLYERANGRTVAQIIADFDPVDAPKVVEAGEVDGMQFTLFETPSENAERFPAARQE